ncbi:hypothetical protein DEJ25_07785 [Curtobacterium sp. MCPF17_011]|uniref:hypothetical protein n=1 Tax=Curtobacterium sp. MCPF17_011 TaxID=2175652 RepID=UPI000DA83D01|nr:hypothetical protein [Curtobacterium sp. MCPF17_011]PZF12624.1 hypothetical protein DEJ25_07785 [Curtobacterium sp. MCPF17_011]
MATASTAALVLGVVLLLTGCRPAGVPEPTPPATPAVNERDAKQQMINAVDDLTGRLGGDWRQGTGPVGDVSSDLAEVEGLWKQQGMTIQRWGFTAHPTIVGRSGDATDSISLSVADQQYGIQALSRCFAGDPDEL